MTPQEIEGIKRELNTILDAAQDKLQYLACRWMDEKEYEDFADYEKEMKKLVSGSFSFMSGTKSPFGFRVAHPKVSRPFQFYANTRSVGWKIVK